MPTDPKQIIDTFTVPLQTYARGVVETGQFTIGRGSEMTMRITRDGWAKNRIAEFLQIDAHVSFDDGVKWQHFVGFGVTEDSTDTESSVTIDITRLPRPFLVKPMITTSKGVSTSVIIDIKQ